ncbi:MAG: metal-dependent hydrolase [Salinisphaera sp.]|nr:metal-dependent hydrolase [Salinisphaera sp.]
MIATHYEIVPRRNLDFHLREDDIPRYWFGGDPFKTRFFDALSLLFPEGERFFIECVRDYRDQVTDPEFAEQIKHFTFQEGQHSRVHVEYNRRLDRQGIHALRAEAVLKKILIWEREHYSKPFTVALTAAAEHMTALMSHFFLENRDVLASADARIRAVFCWHAIEEIEHKAVAFDVMQRVAKAGYVTRCAAMLYVSVLFPLHLFLLMRHMFKRDGFGFGKRVKLWLGGLWWLYGPPRGLFVRMLGHYLAYFRPGYHPWNRGETAVFTEWRQAYERLEQDPIATTEIFFANAA